MVTASLHAFCLKLGMPMEFECHFTVISRLICLETRFVLSNLCFATFSGAYGMQ